VAFVLLLLAGFLLMWERGWAFTRFRWLGLKLGLVLLLLLPLEGMHIWIGHVWIPAALRGSRGGARDLDRGLSMDAMLRTLEVPLLGIGVLLVLWLSFAKPF
jgi:hypothetical protein